MINQTKNHPIENTWLCLNCENRIIPFEKNATAGLIEGGLFLIGVGMSIFINLFFGLILIALSVIITVVRSSGSKKLCPSCESVNIVPATSPAALKLAKPKMSRAR